MKGTELVLKALKDKGVKYIFGYTGGGKMAPPTKSPFRVRLLGGWVENPKSEIGIASGVLCSNSSFLIPNSSFLIPH